jgi:adenylate kinase
MEYQSSNELQPETHDAIHSLPRSDEVVTHARQRLVERLNHALLDDAAAFGNVVNLLEYSAYPLIERNAIAGKCVWTPSGATLLGLGSGNAVQVILDVLSDRGFHASVNETGGQISIAIEWQRQTIRQVR